jgi:hypothetical protein
MASPSVKSTYSLDIETVALLERTAKQWQVSKSEALRRAIRTAAADAAVDTDRVLRALDDLQRSLRLTPAKAAGWAKRSRAERRASSARSERRNT